MLPKHQRCTVQSQLIIINIDHAEHHSNKYNDNWWWLRFPLKLLINDANVIWYGLHRTSTESLTQWSCIVGSRVWRPTRHSLGHYRGGLHSQSLDWYWQTSEWAGLDGWSSVLRSRQHNRLYGRRFLQVKKWAGFNVSTNTVYVMWANKTVQENTQTEYKSRQQTTQNTAIQNCNTQPRNEMNLFYNASEPTQGQRNGTKHSSCWSYTGLSPIMWVSWRRQSNDT